MFSLKKPITFVLISLDIEGMYEALHEEKLNSRKNSSLDVYLSMYLINREQNNINKI